MFNSAVTASWNNRQYLQHFALQIMKENSVDWAKQSGVSPYYQSEIQFKDNTPYMLKSTFDNGKTPNSDLKNNLRSIEQMKVKLVSPSINVNQFS